MLQCGIFYLTLPSGNVSNILWNGFLPQATQPGLQPTQQTCMNKKDFKKYRDRLDKTQKQMAELLGTSLKAIHSYEQGWRTVPVHVERQILFLISRLALKGKKQKPCWVVKKCPPPNLRRSS